MTAAPGPGKFVASNAGSGAHCPWLASTAPIAVRVAQLEAAMTLSEKVAMVHGAGGSPYVGYIPGIPRLCMPALKLEDGPAGVADGMTGVTQLPAPVALAATWDTSLAQAYGAVVGEEEWGKGANVDLGPTVNIVRDPRWGRAFESYGEDPYLAGRVAAAYIRGVQGQGVLAQVKHWVAYNQETHRNTPADDVVISRRALHEIYMPAFEAAIRRGGASSVMCAYSTIEGDFACADAYTQDTVLKSRWRFGGFITSDWGATHSTDASALAGLDIEMPRGRHFNVALDSAVRGGRVPMSRLDDMVRRVLTQEFRFHLFGRPQPGDSSALVTSAGHSAVARRVAERGTVLLRNRGVLPLDSSVARTIAVIGPDAGKAALSGGGGSAAVVAPYVVTPLRGITRRAGSAADVRYAEGVLPPKDAKAVGSALDSESGGAMKSAVALAKASDIAIVFAGHFEEEGRDLDSIGLPGGQDALIRAVAAVNPRTLVVLNTGSAVVMPWLDSVAAVLEAWYPGQEDGAAIAGVLFGDVDPSGKLPVTFPRSLADVPAASPERWPGEHGSVHYAEGLEVGYRWYQARGIAPLFPFGFGLSYTTFRLDDLHISQPTSPAASGPAVTVRCAITNTGKRAGADVVQVYIGDPASSGEPPEQLKAFARVPLAPGETRRLSFTLDPRAFAHWDMAVNGWVVDAGEYTIGVGDSSVDLPLRARVTLPRLSVSRMGIHKE